MQGVKTYLYRLMTCSNTSHLKFSTEDKEAKRFAGELRIWTMQGLVRGVWNHVANEIAGESGGHADEKVRRSLRAKAEIRYAKAQALGMITGWSDYMFCRKDHSLALECKSSTGTQNRSQEDFQKWCEDQGIPYLIFRTAEEGWNILVDYGYLDPRALRSA